MTFLILLDYELHALYRKRAYPNFERVNFYKKTYEMTIKSLYRKTCGFSRNIVFLYETTNRQFAYWGDKIRPNYFEMMITKFNLPFPTVLEHDHQVLHHIFSLNSIYLY